VNQLEKAEAFSNRGIRREDVMRFRAEYRSVKRGGRRCATCGGRATMVGGSPTHPETIRPLCSLCGENAKLDARAARLKEDRAAMRRRS
jgi:hypothetical protein